MCMDAIYEGQPLQFYFEALLRVQTRLLKWQDGFSVQCLYDMMLE